MRTSNFRLEFSKAKKCWKDENFRESLQECDLDLLEIVITRKLGNLTQTLDYLYAENDQNKYGEYNLINEDLVAEQFLRLAWAVEEYPELVGDKVYKQRTGNLNNYKFDIDDAKRCWQDENFRNFLSRNQSVVMYFLMTEKIVSLLDLISYVETQQIDNPFGCFYVTSTRMIEDVFCSIAEKVSDHIEKIKDVA